MIKKSILIFVKMNSTVIKMNLNEKNEEKEEKEEKTKKMRKRKW